MANRQDSGSNPAPENTRPTSQNEDAVPEMTDTVRGRADDEDDEFDVESDEESDEELDEKDDGTF